MWNHADKPPNEDQLVKATQLQLYNAHSAEVFENGDNEDDEDKEQI